jgi:hypothetical protein
MIIFIKDNSLITEIEYTQDFKEQLLNEGYFKLEIPNGSYHYENFEKVNNIWKLKNKD